LKVFFVAFIVVVFVKLYFNTLATTHNKGDNEKYDFRKMSNYIPKSTPEIARFLSDFIIN